LTDFYACKVGAFQLVHHILEQGSQLCKRYYDNGGRLLSVWTPCLLCI